MTVIFLCALTRNAVSEVWLTYINCVKFCQSSGVNKLLSGTVGKQTQTVSPKTPCNVCLAHSNPLHQRKNYEQNLNKDDKMRIEFN